MKNKINTKGKAKILVVVLFTIILASSYLAINSSARFIDPEIPEPPPSSTHTFVVYGYVRSSSGAAISGARVRLTCGDPETGIYKTVYTSSSGYYYASVVTSLYANCKVSVYKSGYNSQTIYVYSKGTNRRDFNLATATHYVSVSGIVKDGITNAPLAGATVKLYSPITSAITMTVTTDSVGYYRVYLYTTEYTDYNLQVSKANYNTEEIQVYSSGSFTKNFALCIPTVQVDVFSPDYIPVSFGNNIKATVQFFSGYSIVDISIRFNLGSGTIDLKDYPTGLTWTILESSCEYVRADGTRTTFDQEDQDLILFSGNCFIHYDAAFDFGTNMVEIHFKVRINSVVFRLEFNTIMRQYQNVHVFYEPVGLTGNAYVESYSDQEYDFMSQILNNIYNDFLSSLYGPEIPLFYDAIANILGTVFGFVDEVYVSHSILRLEFHGS